MKSFFTSILFLISFASNAQNVSFEILENFSKEINNLQRKADGKTYSDGKHYYEVSFPETSFDVSFHNQLATKVVYKKWDGREIVAITENIDLSKAIDIKDMAYGGIAGAVRIYFPTGSLKTQIIENGELINTLDETYVEVFFDKTNDLDKYLLISKINELLVEINRAKNKPYGDWLLQAYYNVKEDNVKKERLLDELIKINNPNGFLNKSSTYLSKLSSSEIKDDNDKKNARIWAQKAIDLGNYDGYYFLALTYFADDKEEFNRLKQKGLDMGSFFCIWDYSKNYSGLGEVVDYKNAIYYIKKALKIGTPSKMAYASALKDLCGYYLKNGDFEEVKELLSDENIYSSGLTEVDIFNISYKLLKESANCNGAEKFLNEMKDGIYINEVKYKVYEELESLYLEGCKGDDGNKVKKDKKLSNEYAVKKYSYAKKQ